MLQVVLSIVLLLLWGGFARDLSPLMSIPLLLLAAWPLLQHSLWWVLQRTNPVVLLNVFLRMQNKSWTLARALGLPHFALDDRVLDAWVACHLPTARTNFEKIPAVAARATHLQLPHTLNGNPVNFTTQYKDILNKARFSLLLCGEGGAGKTSLACWLSHHCMGKGPDCGELRSPIWNEVNNPLAGFPMLPLLLHDGIAGKDLETLLNETLQHLIDAEEPIPSFLLRELLIRRRLLVIVDHLSERDEQTRELLAHLPKDLEINALMVTSRKSGELPGRDPAHVVPTGLSGSALMNFVECLLPLSKPHCGEDEVDEIYSLIKQLSGGFAVTPLLVRLVLDEVAAMQREEAAHPSHNLPELVEGYLVRLCEQAGDRKGLATIARFAAWACIKDLFRPCKGKGSTVRAWLSDANPERLDQLVDAGMLEWVDKEEEWFRFALDPVAEYLAAILLVTSNPETDSVWLAIKQRVMAKLTAEEEAAGQGFHRNQAWEQLLQEVDQAVAADREALVGFLKALHHTVIAMGHAHQVPDEVVQALNQRTSQAGQAAKSSKKSAGLLARLHHEDPGERAYAATRLADLGVNKAKTAAALAERLKLEDDVEVERALVRSLGRIGDRRGIDALVDTVTHNRAVVRLEAARALAQSELTPRGQRALIQMVDDSEEPVAIAVASLLVKIPLDIGVLVTSLVQSKMEDRDGLRDWTLARIGHDMVDAYPSLLPFLEGEDDEVVLAASISFDRLVHVCSEPVSTVIVDALLNNLSRSERLVTASIKALESACIFGKNRQLARRSFGPLAELLMTNTNKAVIQAATRALFTLFRQADKPPPLEELLNWVGDNTPQREGLLSFIRMAEKEAQHMAEDLKKLLTDDDMKIRYRAAMALAPYDKGEDSLQLLTEALQDQGFEERAEAARVLGELGENASSSLWVLVALAGPGNQDEALRKASQDAVSSIKRDMVAQSR